MNPSDWKISDIAAWWGAVIATLALVWNIVVALRSGARIQVTATPNMLYIPSDPITKDKKYIYVKAVNRGTAPTTITHLCGFYSDSLWNFIRKKQRNA